MPFWRSREQQPDHTTQARLTFMQHEYLSIRAELVAAVSSQQTVMTYAMASIAVIFTGLVTSWSNTGLRTGILGLTPLLLMFLWFVWFGEVLRLARTRRFLWSLEQKINALLRAPQTVAVATDLPMADVLHWESWVRGRNPWRRNLHSRPAYHLATGVLCGTGLGTATLSVVLASISPMGLPLRLLAYGGAGAFVGLCGYALLLVRRNPILRENSKGI